MMHRLLLTLLSLALVSKALPAGTFLLTEDVREATPDAVSHPIGYDGTGGELTVGVCIDPSSPFADELVVPVMKAVDTLNGLVPTTGTYVPPGQSQQVPSGFFDAESTVLHEVTHCIGLGHINLADLLTPAQALCCGDAAMSNEGADSEYSTVSIGLDNIWGSADDLRGDDVNLAWYMKATNDPFLIPSPVPSYDQTNYTRDLATLPKGDNYAAVGTPKVAEELGYQNTKAIMYAQTSVDSEFRSLAHDDVAMIRYGMSGLDETAGTADDYSITLEFVAFPCDVPINYESFGPVDAVGRCRFALSADPIAGTTDHYNVVPTSVELNSDIPGWFFGSALDLAITKTDGDIEVLPGGDIAYTLEVSNVGSDVDATGVEIEETVPDFTTFNAAASDPGWSCTDIVAGSECLLSVGGLTAGGPSVQATFVVTVDNPVPGGVEEIFNLVRVSDDGNNGPDPNAGNDQAQESTPISSGVVFEDGFESGDTSSWSQAVP